jgi:hypothetical protein
VLAKFGGIDSIPTSHTEWDIPGLRGAEKLARTLADRRDDALLFREIATIALDVPVGRVDEWRWAGPTDEFAAVAERLGATSLVARAQRVADAAARRA